MPRINMEVRSRVKKAYKIVLHPCASLSQDIDSNRTDACCNIAASTDSIPTGGLTTGFGDFKQLQKNVVSILARILVTAW